MCFFFFLGSSERQKHLHRTDFTASETPEPKPRGYESTNKYKHEVFKTSNNINVWMNFFVPPGFGGLGRQYKQSQELPAVWGGKQYLGQLKFVFFELNWLFFLCFCVFVVFRATACFWRATWRSPTCWLWSIITTSNLFLSTALCVCRNLMAGLRSDDFNARLQTQLSPSTFLTWTWLQI